MLIGALLAVLAAASPQSGGKTVTSNSGGFSVWFPGEPEESAIVKKTAIGDVKATVYQFAKADFAFVVTWNDFPLEHVSKSGSEALLKAGMEGVARSFGARTSGESALTLGKWPGLEATLEGSTEKGKMRLYLVGNRYYQLGAFFKKGAEDWKGLQRTFDSFRLIEEAAGPEKKTDGASPSTGGGTALRPRIRILDPWTDSEIGAWFRYKTTAGDEVRFEDLGLKAKQESGNVLLTQQGTSAATENVVAPRKISVVGTDSLKVSGRTLACEIQSPLDENGKPDTSVRHWVLKEGRGAGAILKMDSKEATLSPTKVWDHTLKIKGREFECLVVEGDLSIGGQSSPLKRWNTSGLPRPIREEREGEASVLVDFGSDWAKRPPFPAAGR